ncbi:TolC family protein [Spirochaeta cellobiosiphila]|uniref:TolC family protein n=1 Tax=Spirochaeta cellobiosiphila TaxID=504483 RepID=UPI0004205225|nr:TolC family protein [Spirochaeta cellobiosiphila]
MNKTLITTFLSILLLSPSLIAQDIDLSLSEAINRTLSGDTRVKSSQLSIQINEGKLKETQLERLPSFNLGASYTRLSHIRSTVSLGAASFDIDSNDNAYALKADLQYPIYTGFRIQEAINLAKEQVSNSALQLEVLQNAIRFETERAYWETLRAQKNVSMLKENLTLTKQNRNITQEKYKNGTVLKVDLLEARMRYDQAEMDLEAGITYEKKASINLADLINLTQTDGKFTEPLFSLTTDPYLIQMSQDLSLEELVNKALLNRPEIKSSNMAILMSETQKKIQEANLQPTVSFFGNYTYANPNSRVFLQSDPDFVGTWSLGVGINYDLGGLPSHMTAAKTSQTSINRAQVQRQQQENSIIKDVRNCYLSYTQLKKDLDHVKKMLGSAQENERVTKQRVASGTASDLDQLEASVLRLQREFAIVNKQIDLQIATADLLRATAIPMEIKP